MTEQQMIEVIQAKRDGQTIQYRKQKSVMDWAVVKDPVWDFSSCEYRVKPEPRTIWIRTYSDGSTRVFDNEADALRTIFPNTTLVKYQEVLS